MDAVYLFLVVPLQVTDRVIDRVILCVKLLYNYCIDCTLFDSGTYIDTMQLTFSVNRVD